MNEVFALKACASVLMVLGVACIPNFIRAATYPFWQVVEAKVTCAMTRGGVEWDVNGRVDRRYRTIDVEYEFGQKQYRTRLENGSGFPDISTGGSILIRVCRTWPSLAWADPGQDKNGQTNLSLYVAGLVFHSAIVFGSIAGSVAIWGFRG